MKTKIETLGTDPQDFAVTLNYMLQAVADGDKEALELMAEKLRAQTDQLEEECEAMIDRGEKPAGFGSVPYWKRP